VKRGMNEFAFFLALRIETQMIFIPKDTVKVHLAFLVGKLYEILSVL
jgi:hypothetical protein